jgi:hypothetical protein
VRAPALFLASIIVWPCVGIGLVVLAVLLGDAAGIHADGLEVGVACVIAATTLSYVVAQRVMKEALAGVLMGLLTLVTTPLILVAIYFVGMSSLR